MKFEKKSEGVVFESRIKIFEIMKRNYLTFKKSTLFLVCYFF